MQPPLISLITVVKNGAATIERALKSVEAQGYERLEYIVFDGASTDGTQDIIARYRPLIAHYRSQPDGGSYAAAEEALALAKGDIIGFLHADDWLADGACAELARLHQQQPQAALYTFAMTEHALQGDGASQPTRLYCDPSANFFPLETALYCHGVNRFYGRSALPYLHFRTDRYPLVADRDLYIRLSLAALPAAQSHQVLYHFLTHPGSRSSDADSAMKITRLAETAQMALDHLAEAKSEHTALFAHWYCFTALRLAFFRLREGDVSGAARDVFSMLKLPGALHAVLRQPRIPFALRPRSVS